MHTGGNLSVRDPKTGLVVIKPTSVPYRTMRPEDVPVIDLDGRLVEGRLKASSEWPMHTMIYRAKPRVMGIVHHHSIYATACSVAGLEVPLINHEISVYCSSPVRVAPFEVPGTVELGESALRHLGDDNDIVLLQNHGPLAVGATLWHAFDAACAIEQTAATFYITRVLGAVTPVPSEGRRALRDSDPLRAPDDGTSPVIKAV
jgi:L-ribulose-5-phosphate 4-epimerase